MTPVADNPMVLGLPLQLRRERMHQTVHFGHPPGRYLCVAGANSTVPGTYVFATGPRALQFVFWSPPDLNSIGEESAVETLCNLEGAHTETLDAEFGGAEHQNQFADLDAVIGAIRESRPLSPPSPEVADLIARAVQLQGAPVDINEWARQLADDVADLTD